MHMPRFCQSHHDLPTPLSGTCLAQARFDPAQLQAEDFSRCGVPPVRGVAKRQAEHLAGRLCARAALHSLSGQGPIPGRDSDGVPLWPQGITGSITHGNGQAAALVAWTRDWRGLGIDLEHQLQAERAARLAQEILTADELQRAAGLTADAFAQRVTLTFSLKESLFKALYPLTLTRFYFHDAELLEMDHDSARLRLLIDLHPDWRTGAELDGQFALFDNKVLSLVAVAA